MMTPRPREGKDGCSRAASVEIRTRSPAPGLSQGPAFTVPCVTGGGGGGRWAQDADPYSCLFWTPTGLPLLFTSMWVGCKLAFEDVA